MTIGPGKYDNLTTLVREVTGATGVLLIVIGGAIGGGFSVQATTDITESLPAMLRGLANDIEADVKGGLN